MPTWRFHQRTDGSGVGEENSPAADGAKGG
jgi:hypothetical protein